MDILRKVSWQERAKMVAAYKKEYHLSLRAIADEFDYSPAKIHYDLMLAAALDKYPEIKKIEKVTEAIKFIKAKNFKLPDEDDD